MKFAEKLAAHLTPEWRSQYISYQALKSMLIEALENVPQNDPRALSAYYEIFDEYFFSQCEVELHKINNFFAEKMAEAIRKNTELIYSLRELIKTGDKSKVHHSLDLRGTLNKRHMHAMRFAFSEFYLSLVLLQNYQSLNHTGFRKILKKHDKLLDTNTGLKWFMDHVDSAPFYTNRELMNLIRDTENIFTRHLAGGDRHRAMKRLRVPPLAEKQNAWTTFRAGLFLGAFFVFLMVIILKLQTNSISKIDYIAFVHLYRGPLLVITMLFLFSLNVYGFRAVGVNHILIFEIDPRDHLTFTDITELSCWLALLWAISILGFLYHKEIGIPPFVCPLFLLCCMLGWLLNPLSICYYTARLWMIKLVGRVCAAPFYPVSFADFWLGDQLNSLVISLTDYKYTICFYITNRSWTQAYNAEQCIADDHFITAVVRCLPAWFRFAQCVRRYYDTKEAYPFLLNAGKYATSFPVATFATLANAYSESYEYQFLNPFLWGFLICYVISSIYCYAWDILKDFGFFAKFSGEHIFLRDQIVYREFFYYFAIIEDFLLRFFWTLSFFLTEQSIISNTNMTTIAAFLEVIRRYIWNYFRLENEHLYNVGRFRAVRDIAIIPMDPGDKVALLRRMDEVDGVTNRHNSSLEDNESPLEQE